MDFIIVPGVLILVIYGALVITRFEKRALARHTDPPGEKSGTPRAASPAAPVDRDESTRAAVEAVLQHHADSLQTAAGQR